MVTKVKGGKDMWTTEKEAERKQCPLTRGGVARSCRGCKCMAWRWNREKFNDLEEAKPKEPVGYCGLAGKPDCLK